MTPSDTPPAVADYLRRLEAAAADLPPDVRADLLADLQGHLEEAVERAAGSEADLRQALDRLGTPEAIAAEARGAPVATATTPATAGARTTSRRGFDVTALVFLVLGGLALTFLLSWFGTILGWSIGVGMLWASRSWTSGEKLLGTLVWPGGLVAPLLLATMSTQVCTTVTDSLGTTTEECTGFAFPIWAGIPVMLLVTAAPLVVAVVLLRRADRRR